MYDCNINVQPLPLNYALEILSLLKSYFAMPDGGELCGGARSIIKSDTFPCSTFSGCRRGVSQFDSPPPHLSQDMRDPPPQRSPSSRKSGTYVVAMPKAHKKRSHSSFYEWKKRAVETYHRKEEVPKSSQSFTPACVLTRVFHGFLHLQAI